MFLPLDAPIETDLRPSHSDISVNDWEILSHFWYPIALQRQVKDQPLKATLLDVDLVLFRGKGDELAVAVDVCPHRHVRLSAGKVIEGEIECPFHGLRFDSSGRCQRVPALGRAAKLPASYKVRTFPVEVRYGIVWTCLGDPEKHQVPHFPTLAGHDPSEFGFSEPAVWPVSAPRQVENFIDLAHLPLVHADTLGGDLDAGVQPGRIEHTNDAVISRTRYIETGINAHDGQPTPVDFIYRIVLPFAVEFQTRHVNDPAAGMDSCDIPSPVSAHSSKVFQIIRLDAGGEASQATIDAGQIVNDEDINVLQHVVRPDLPLDQRHEIHLPPDNVSAAYRQRLRQLGLGAPSAPKEA